MDSSLRNKVLASQHKHCVLSLSVSFSMTCGQRWQSNLTLSAITLVI